MNPLIKKTAAVSMFCLMAATMQAQSGRYDRPYDGRYRREPLDEVRADLDRAARDMNYLSRPEMNRFNKVRHEIGEFQRKWERGKFDRRELDDVIRSLDQVVNRNRLHPRDRDLLLNDIARLRGFRDHGR